MRKFNEKQIEMLNDPLDVANVALRDGFKDKLSYIETHQALRDSNRIFYHDWDRVVTVTLIGTSCSVNKYKQKMWKVAYSAKATIIAGGSTRDGHGFGSSSKKALEDGSMDVDIHELAIKEAESDATKRALTTFGDQFGLCLYDDGAKDSPYISGKYNPVTGATVMSLREAGFATARERTELFNAISNDLLDCENDEDTNRLLSEVIEDVKRISSTDSELRSQLATMFKEKGADFNNIS